MVHTNGSKKHFFVFLVIVYNFKSAVLTFFSDRTAPKISNEIVIFSNATCIYLLITLLPFVSLFLQIIIEFLASKTIGAENLRTISCAEDELLLNKLYCQISNSRNKRNCVTLIFFEQKGSGNKCLYLENRKELEAQTWYFFSSP